MGSISKIFFVFLSVVVILSNPVLAQVTTGIISGTVRDESGAVLPAVTLTIKHLETQITRTAVSDEAGLYRAPGLALGTYEVQAELQGFQTAVRSGIHLTVGREAVADVTLKIGEISERVVVTGEASLVETSTSTISQLVDEKKVRDLPLNGRDYLQLSTLQPGVLLTRTASRTLSGQTQRGTGVQVSISGGRPTQNNYQLNGVSISDYNNTGPGSVTGNNLGVEAIREFSVLTNTYSAEYGRSSGGVVNAVTRSGTNEFHGSVLEFHRNDNMDAGNFFDRFDPARGEKVLPEFKRNQFGAAAGGPVLRDKTFVFGNYEGLREALGITSRTTVLSEAAKNGVLANKTIAVDPAVKPYLRFSPNPNGAIFPLGETGEFIVAGSQVTREDYFTIRMDHKFSDADTLGGSYTFDNARIVRPDSFLANDRINRSRHQYLTVEEKRIFSPTVLNSVRFGFNRSFIVGGLTEARIPGLEDPALSFIPGKAYGAIGVPGMSFPAGPTTEDQDRYAFNSWQGRDDVNLTRGRHSLKLGFNVERMQNNAASTNINNGRYDFGNIEFFLLNQPSIFTGNLAGTDPARGHRQSLFGMYVQDDVRMRPNLSVNLGVRYEFITVPREVNGKEANLVHITDPTTQIGPIIENPSLRNIAPRIGLAWDPTGSGKMSLRAGFGIFYDQFLVNYLTLPGSRTAPFFRQGTATVLPGDFPKGGFQRLATDPRVTLRATFIDPKPGSSYRTQYNLSLQREIAPQTVASIAYVGGRGVHLSSPQEDVNYSFEQILPDGRVFFPSAQPKRNPVFGLMPAYFFDANSFYNGLQLGLSKRFSRGFQVQGAYNFSKSVDDSSAVFNVSHYSNSAGNPYAFNHKYNRGLSDFDLRHTFVLNYTVDLPGPAPATVAGKVLGGWQLGGILSLSSGTPFTVGFSFDRARTGTVDRSGRAGQRPNLASGFSTNPIQGIPSQWYNPKAFLLPDAGFFGNLGRGTLQTDGLATYDFSLSKNLGVSNISEEFQAQFRLEIFNLFNHANFGVPSRTIFDSQGRTVSDAGRITTTTSTARQIQLGLKIVW